MIRLEDDRVHLPPATLTLLGDLLPGNLSEYYSYHGNVLGTVCLADIIWFDLIYPIEVGVDFVRFLNF